MLGWFKALSGGKKAGVIIASFFALGAIGNVTNPPQNSVSTQKNNVADQQKIEIKQAPAKVKALETKEVKEDQPIPFTSTAQNDPYLTKGQSVISPAGVNGIKTITYKVTLEDGVEKKREKVKEEITKQSIVQITKIGTYVAPAPSPAPRPQASNCDPNYSGGCVPIASDVDCGGGSGNGPAYFYGTANVIGSDIYGLDRDNDGLACE